MRNVSKMSSFLLESWLWDLSFYLFFFFAVILDIPGVMSFRTCVSAWLSGICTKRGFSPLKLWIPIPRIW